MCYHPGRLSMLTSILVRGQAVCAAASCMRGHKSGKIWLRFHSHTDHRLGCYIQNYHAYSSSHTYLLRAFPCASPRQYLSMASPSQKTGDLALSSFQLHGASSRLPDQSLLNVRYHCQEPRLQWTWWQRTPALREEESQGASILS